MDSDFEKEQFPFYYLKNEEEEISLRQKSINGVPETSNVHRRDVNLY